MSGTIYDVNAMYVPFVCYYSQSPEFYQNIALISRSITFNQAKGCFGFGDSGKFD